MIYYVIILSTLIISISVSIPLFCKKRDHKRNVTNVVTGFVTPAFTLITNSYKVTLSSESLPVDPHLTTVSGPALLTAMAGVQTSFNITPRNKDGTHLPNDSDFDFKVELLLNGKSACTDVTTQIIRDANYTMKVTFTPEVAGTYVVSATFKGCSILTPTRRIVVAAGEISYLSRIVTDPRYIAAESPFCFVLTAYDIYENRIVDGGEADKISVTLLKNYQPTPISITYQDFGDGTYRFELKLLDSSEDSIYQLKVLINNRSIVENVEFFVLAPNQIKDIAKSLARGRIILKGTLNNIPVCIKVTKSRIDIFQNEFCGLVRRSLLILGIQRTFFSLDENTLIISSDLVHAGATFLKLNATDYFATLAKVQAFKNSQLTFLSTHTFEQKLEYLALSTKKSTESISVFLKRGQVFEDTLAVMNSSSSTSISKWRANIMVRFENEPGIDFGGLRQEWFYLFAREAFDPRNGFFERLNPQDPVSRLHLKVGPRSFSETRPRSGSSSTKMMTAHKRDLRSIGRFVGKAIIEGQSINVSLSRALLQYLRRSLPGFYDLEFDDPAYYSSLKSIILMDLDSMDEELYFIDEDGNPLIHQGATTKVTNQNKYFWCDRLAKDRFITKVQTELENFSKGVYDLVPPHALRIFTVDELDLLIAGPPIIDIENLSENTEYENCNTDSDIIIWFWQLLRSMNKLDLERLLLFVTGRPRAPIAGFSQLEPKFKIALTDTSVDLLPTASTCTNNLFLSQNFKTYEQLKTHLLISIRNGCEGFGIY